MLRNRSLLFLKVCFSRQDLPERGLLELGVLLSLTLNSSLACLVPPSADLTGGNHDTHALFFAPLAMIDSFSFPVPLDAGLEAASFILTACLGNHQLNALTGSRNLNLCLSPTYSPAWSSAQVYFLHPHLLAILFTGFKFYLEF